MVQCMPACFYRVPTATLQPASTSPKPLSVEAVIAHEVPVAMDVLKALSGLVKAVGVMPEGTQQIRQVSVSSSSWRRFYPLAGLRSISAVNLFRDTAEGLFDMKAIHDLNGLRKEFLRDFPDPLRTVANHHRAAGF
jgi:hypothetical protein